jgi:hypothetical protein
MALKTSPIPIQNASTARTAMGLAEFGAPSSVSGWKRLEKDCSNQE